jgi:catechol 2,3-dioxygenase-like lactoylglutathione lyase family enzyme
MKIKLTHIYVDDQENALRFYTDVLGFVKKADVRQGPYRWLTVASSEDPDGPELQLAPDDDPAAQAYRRAISRIILGNGCAVTGADPRAETLQRPFVFRLLLDDRDGGVEPLALQCRSLGPAATHSIGAVVGYEPWSARSSNRYRAVGMG